MPSNTAHNIWAMIHHHIRTWVLMHTNSSINWMRRVLKNALLYSFQYTALRSLQFYLLF